MEPSLRREEAEAKADSRARTKTATLEVEAVTMVVEVAVVEATAGGGRGAAEGAGTLARTRDERTAVVAVVVTTVGTVAIVEEVEAVADGMTAAAGIEEAVARELATEEVEGETEAAMVVMARVETTRAMEERAEAVPLRLRPRRAEAVRLLVGVVLGEVHPRGGPVVAHPDLVLEGVLHLALGPALDPDPDLPLVARRTKVLLPRNQWRRTTSTTAASVMAAE
mmetsp:Transcript_54896/g.117180  ORF Transcript_54896/g.117180 Transcript_54896/m.117180 type:complete len:224 (+) Transcript_54896:575-1246(+)